MYAKRESFPYSEENEEILSSKTSSSSKAKKNTQRNNKKTFWEKYQNYILIAGGVVVVGAMAGYIAYLLVKDKKNSKHIHYLERALKVLNNNHPSKFV
jgi:hypothetical protein